MKSTAEFINQLKIEVYDLNAKMGELQQQIQEVNQECAEKNAAIKQAEKSVLEEK